MYEPTLSESREEEEEEFQRAKKAIQLIKVLAGIMPANFSSAEVFERLITLLRLEDKEIGKVPYNYELRIELGMTVLLPQ